MMWSVSYGDVKDDFLEDMVLQPKGDNTPQNIL